MSDVFDDYIAKCQKDRKTDVFDDSITKSKKDRETKRQKDTRMTIKQTDRKAQR